MSTPPSPPPAGGLDAADGAVAAIHDAPHEKASDVAAARDRDAPRCAQEARKDGALPTTAAPRPQPPQPLQPPQRPQHYGTVFTNAKAGMESVDFDHVKKVVFEASANSLHGAHQAKRDAALAARVEALRERALHLKRFEPGTVSAAERNADALASRLLPARDRGRQWVCLDMDAFFFSVEARDDPERLLRRDLPFAVGSTSMITTANGEARKCGVRSAMPGYIAVRLCPQLQFVKPNFDKYVAASKQVMACLERFDPRCEPSGLDEAFVEVTDFVSERRKRGGGGEGSEAFSALDAANEIRAAVRAATSLPSSCGVAPNKLLAKIASDMGKPDGAFAVPRDPSSIAAFVAGLPVRKVPGIGRVTERILDGALGVTTCAQLFANRGLVFCLFGKATAEFLLAGSLGVGSDEHSSEGDGEGGERQRKGLSAERTFAPSSDLAFLEGKLAEIAERVAEGVKAEGLRPKTLTLKVKFATFDVISRAASAGGGGGGGGGNANDPAVSSLCSGVSSFNDPGRIAAVAAALFRAECLGGGGSARGSGALSPPPPAAAAAAAAAAPSSSSKARAPVRLLGIRLSNWENAVVPVERGQRRLDDVLAAAMSKEPNGGAEVEAAAASTSDAAAAPPPAAAKGDNPPSSSSSASSTCWTCSLCTYAETRLFSLRCDVCGTPRGATSCGSLLAEGAIAEEEAVAGGSGKDQPKTKKRSKPAAAPSSAAPLDAFFVRKK